MMVGAFTAGKGRAEYAYNGFKNRVKKLESLQNPSAMQDMQPDPIREIRYVLDMTLPYDNLLMTQGSQNQSFVWGNGLLSASGDNKFYYLQDHLGSPIRLVGEDDTDAPLAYDEFGVPLVETGQNLNNPFGFTGYQLDEVSGLYFAQARYYEPRFGRFGAEDTHWNPGNMIYGDNLSIVAQRVIKPDLQAIRQSSNLYVYCMNSPIRFFDSTGKTAAEIAAGAWTLGGTISQLDSPLPGPADVIGLAVGIVGSVIAGGVLIHESVGTYKSNKALEMAQVASDLGDIARSRGNGECVDAANDMADYLTKKKKKFQFAEFQYTGQGFVVSNSSLIYGPNTAISETGYHVGILYEGRIYCNVHPLGLPQNDWFDDFEGVGIQIPHIGPIPLGGIKLLEKFKP